MSTGHMFLRPQIFSASERIVAGFSTRRNGVSRPPYDSLNLGLSTGDQEDHVVENRRLLFESAGFSLDQLAITGQVHGTECLTINRPGLYRGYDALVTRKPGIMLSLSAADCASVLLADEKGGVIGACHAGWRGAAGGIVGRTIEAMVRTGGVPERIRAYVSPCISRDHFEVGEEVAARFVAEVVHRRPGWSRPHVDLKAALRLQLIQSGVLEHSVEIAPQCTYAETDLFFSHRAERGITGRLMGFIGMIG